jgi:hypothetical protein
VSSPIWVHDQISITLWQLRSCFCEEDLYHRNYKSLIKSHSQNHCTIARIVLNHTLNLHMLISCTPQAYCYRLVCVLLPLLLTRNCSEPSWTLTYIAAERTCIIRNLCHVINIQPVHWRKLHGPTANTCHVTANYSYVTSPWTRKTQLPLLLRVGPCLQSCCLATRWSNPLQYFIWHSPLSELYLLYSVWILQPLPSSGVRQGTDWTQLRWINGAGTCPPLNLMTATDPVCETLYVIIRRITDNA